ncbi:MAG: type II toxin-antitoxin system HicB family antitoxin [Gemmataceae bacterium]
MDTEKIDYEENEYWYFVVIRRTQTGYSVDVPDLDGCVATGTTVEHARHMIEEAITMHLEMMQQSGEKLPAPRRSMEVTIDPDAGEEFYTWVDVEVPQPAAAS